MILNNFKVFSNFELAQGARHKAKGEEIDCILCPMIHAWLSKTYPRREETLSNQ
jgi:hypothetical protein